ncbi:hypothetical protein D1816_21930 [Aquimarina sp. AD10]|uniref:Glycine dehydrogenase n=1 Tax=Aquimarina aggregata TaxID=1642818 RepID=A0A163AT43_9FLAO|nr:MULTISPECIES: hypothetical protein [Aquimarina]AXT62885.1 hypothetical protein D1816_21930 [Aquimarina sp. AD10]KZS40782.1 glycine dehydrogenase [Aquimarina aggregata]RKM94253.1 hypothetical protein D7033_18570 [Aquimarina sp. AD10]
MKTTNNIFVSCEQAKYICDKNQYGEASALEIIQLNLRLVYCRVTRAYSKRNTKLTQMIEKSNIQAIDVSQKKVMKQKLHEELTK